jgi:hypothetical protein
MQWKENRSERERWGKGNVRVRNGKSRKEKGTESEGWKKRGIGWEIIRIMEGSGKGRPKEGRKGQVKDTQRREDQEKDVMAETGRTRAGDSKRWCR